MKKGHIYPGQRNHNIQGHYLKVKVWMEVGKCWEHLIQRKAHVDDVCSGKLELYIKIGPRFLRESLKGFKPYH